MIHSESCVGFISLTFLNINIKSAVHGCGRWAVGSKRVSIHGRGLFSCTHQHSERKRKEISASREFFSLKETVEIRNQKEACRRKVARANASTQFKIKLKVMLIP